MSAAITQTADQALLAGLELGRYRILRRIAADLVAEVAVARAEGFSRPVALKCLHPHLASDPEMLRLFEREAAIAARLRHPNLVPAFDHGFVAGRAFMAMELAHGVDLRAILRRAEVEGQRVPLELVLRIGIDLCDALHFAHTLRGDDGRLLGVIHREVSPRNVHIGFDGVTRLVDFGVASAGAPAWLSAGAVWQGRAGYLSPEQCLGEPIDARTDVFALGVVLYELTVGRRPFRGRTETEVMEGIVEGNPPAPGELVADYDPDLEPIVLAALASNPAARFQTAADLGALLRQLLDDRGFHVGPEALRAWLGELFADKVDAWRRAQQLGRTLIEHLAEVEGEWERAVTRPAVEAVPAYAGGRRQVLPAGLARRRPPSGQADPASATDRAALVTVGTPSRGAPPVNRTGHSIPAVAAAERSGRSGATTRSVPAIAAVRRSPTPAGGVARNEPAGSEMLPVPPSPLPSPSPVLSARRSGWLSGRGVVLFGLLLLAAFGAASAASFAMRARHTAPTALTTPAP